MSPTPKAVAAYLSKIGTRGGSSTSTAKQAASRANGKRGGRPRKEMHMRAIDKIAEEYRDSDGYWIYLKPGWQNGNDPGTHGIVENTKRAAYSVLRSAKPCDCGECRSRK